MPFGSEPVFSNAHEHYLHGIGGDECPITVITEKTGKKEQEKLVYERTDFWATTTSNKQLNFVQHIANMLKIDGKAAVVVPDVKPMKVLFRRVLQQSVL